MTPSEQLRTTLIEMAEQTARRFAEFTHGNVLNPDGTRGQRRKYSGEPYIVHLDEVVAILKEAGETDVAVIEAAYLHDVLEDTPFGARDILVIYDEEILGLMLDLTDVYTKDAYPLLNRKERKAAEAERLGSIGSRARRIKYADLISNARSIVAGDRNFARIFIDEANRLVAKFPYHPDNPVELELRNRTLAVLKEVFLDLALNKE